MGVCPGQPAVPTHTHPYTRSHVLTHVNTHTYNSNSATPKDLCRPHCPLCPGQILNVEGTRMGNFPNNKKFDRI